MKPSPLPRLIATTLLALAAATVHAERGDRDRPVNLEADRITLDDAKKVHVLEGNVTLTQGSMQIRASRVVVSQDADGYQKVVASGNPTRFKQKREAKDEFIEGEAERIEHNGRTEKTEFFNRAWVKSGLDELRGHYIGYDGLTERYVVNSASEDGKPAPAGSGRVRVVIQPKTKGEAAANKAGEPLPLKSAPQLKPGD